MAPASILAELAREFDDIRAGKLAGMPAGNGILQYKGAQITFFVRTAP